MIADPNCPVGRERGNHSLTDPGCTCSPSRVRRETGEGPLPELDPTPRCDCGGVVTTRVHYPGRSLSACAVCALAAANVAMGAGWPVTLEPLHGMPANYFPTTADVERLEAVEASKT